MFGHQLMSHPSRSAQESHISPTSPQMWITPVYKGVDNYVWGVRFAGSVRLSPSVDRLWTNRVNGVVSTTSRCAQSGASCVRRRSTGWISTNTHTPAGRRSTVRTHARSRTSRWIAPLVHSFPNPYDDYYFKNFIAPHNAYALPAVDRSRTLGVPGPFSRSDPRPDLPPDPRTSVEGGHE